MTFKSNKVLFYPERVAGKYTTFERKIMGQQKIKLVGSSTKKVASMHARVRAHTHTHTRTHARTRTHTHTQGELEQDSIRLEGEVGKYEESLSLMCLYSVHFVTILRASGLVKVTTSLWPVSE